MTSGGDVSYQRAIIAIEHARITRTESHIEIYLDIPSKMLPSVLRAKVSKRYDLPIVFVTGIGTEREWWVDGIVYNPFGGPAISVSNSQEQKIIYHNSEGYIANDNGPAVQKHKYGVLYIEEWTKNSQKYPTDHREGGPAFTRFEYEIPNKQTWLEFTIDRSYDINPATDVSPKFLNPGDQVTVFREKEFSWYKHGKCYSDGTSHTHQEDYGIAVYTRIDIKELDMYQRSYTVKRRLLWKNEEGKLHRVDGPACVELYHVEETQKTTAGKTKKGATKHGTWKTSWVVNDRTISTKHVLDWCQKNRVVLRDGPCFNKSSFTKAEDELCFITDFLKLN